uniref:C2H2-type domain-containing protein n=1 Tax=Glossina brevipalpis TaxID=37001 RepID=A0A1A9WSC5_9MUSC
MNYDFLRTYSIPLRHSSGDKHISQMNRTYEQREAATNYETLLPPPAPPLPLAAADYDRGSYTYYDDNTMINYVGPASNAAEVCYKNRFIPPAGKHGINYLPEIHGKPVKRKYNAGPGSIEKISETTADGKLVLFQGRDESYPDELNKLIHPMSCELCDVKMNSLLSAKDHYESKVHDRGLSAWLKKNYVEKGLEAPPVKRFLKQGTTGPDAYYCEACDLKLTSLAHANQHYAGKKHRLVISKFAKPSGAGYYDSEGRWVRTASKQSVKAPNDGRYGIGEQFKISSSSSSTNTNASIDVKPNQETNTQPDSLLFCSMCSVSVTSALQMAMHLNGIKHKKKLQKTGAESAIVTNESSVDQPVTTCFQLQENVLSTVLQADSTTTDPSDLSMYRTPSGQFYCKVCNTTMTNVPSLQQHLSGKRHLKAQAEEKAKASLTVVNVYKM